MDNISPEEATDFALWTGELHGPEVAGMAPATQAYRRVVFGRDANGVPTYKNPIYVPVDKYGLPVPAEGAHPSQEEKLELRWDATLLTYPLPEPRLSTTIPFSTRIKHLTAEVLHGNIRQDPVRVHGVQEWKAAGFTPELYGLLHALVPQTVQIVVSRAVLRGAQAWLRERLDTLGIHSTMEGEVLRLEMMAQQWGDFPGLLFKVSPAEAVQLIISLGMPPHAEV